MVFYFLLSACVDAWERDRAACGLEDGRGPGWADVQETEAAWNSLELPPGCAEVLVQSVGGHPAALLEEIGVTDDLDTHLEAVRTRARNVDGLVALAWGLYWLLGTSYGTVEDLETADPYTDPSWRDRYQTEARARGMDAEDPLSALLYDLITTRTLSVDWMPDGAPQGAGMGMVGGILGNLNVKKELDEELGWVVNPWHPTVAAESLVHEVAHAVVGRRAHVECDAPAGADGRFCDPDLTGAYGAGFAAISAQARVALAEACDDDDEGAFQVVSANVLFLDTSWSSNVMLPPPDRPDTNCD